MKKLFLILIAILAIGLTANLAISKTGGVKVDNDTDCTNGTQSKTFECGQTGYVQINASSDNFDSSITCQVCQNGTAQSGNNQNCENVTCSFENTCQNGGASYYTYSFPVQGAGVETLVVNDDGTGKNVGADTFKVVCE